MLAVGKETETSKADQHHRPRRRLRDRDRSDHDGPHPTIAGIGVEIVRIGPATGQAVAKLFASAPASSGADVGNLLDVQLIEAVDVSNAIAWLVSDEARYVTAVALPITEPASQLVGFAVNVASGQA